MYELTEGAITEIVRCTSFEEFVTMYRQLRKTQFKDAQVYPVMTPQQACVGVVLYSFAREEDKLSYGVELTLPFYAIYSSGVSWELFQDYVAGFEPILEAIFQQLDKEVKNETN